MHVKIRKISIQNLNESKLVTIRITTAIFFSFFTFYYLKPMIPLFNNLFNIQHFLISVGYLTFHYLLPIVLCYFLISLLSISFDLDCKFFLRCVIRFLFVNLLTYLAVTFLSITSTDFLGKYGLFLLPTFFVINFFYLLRKARLTLSKDQFRKPLINFKKIFRIDISQALLSLIITRLIFSPIVSTDSLFYWTGLAKSWGQSWPKFPSNFGPGVGSEMSYSFPNLLSGIGIIFSKMFGCSSDMAIKGFLVFMVLTLYFILKALNEKFGGWIALFFLSLPTIGVNLFSYNGYIVSCVMALMIIYLLKNWQRDVISIFQTLAILSLSGIAGLIFCFWISMPILFFTFREKTLSTVHKYSFLYFLGPVGAFFVSQYLRSNSLFFPFVTWPNEYSKVFMNTLKTTNTGIIDNAVISLGPSMLHHGAAFRFMKYLLSGSTVPGGLFFVIYLSLLSWKYVGKKDLIFWVLLFATFFPFILFFLDLFWFRYTIPVIVIIFGFIATSEELFSLLVAGLDLFFSRLLLIFAAVIITMKSIVLSVGINSDSISSLHGDAYFQDFFPPIQKLLNMKYMLSLSYGSSPAAWDEVDKLVKLGIPVGNFDDLGLTVIGYKSSLSYGGISSFPSNSGYPTSEQILKKHRLYLTPGSSFAAPETDPQYSHSIFWDTTPPSIPCETWPGRSYYEYPSILWQIASSVTSCPHQKVWIAHKDSLAIVNNGILHFAGDSDSQIPENFITSYVNYSGSAREFSLNANSSINYLKKRFPLSWKEMYPGSTEFQAMIRFGSHLSQHLTFSGKLPTDCSSICNFSLPKTPANSVVSLEIDGYQSVHSMSFKDLKEATK